MLILSVFCVYTAFMVIIVNNPILCLAFFILTVLNIGISIICLGFDLFGLIFITIYIGAIAVFFLFVVMLLNIQYTIEKISWKNWIFVGLWYFIFKKYHVDNFEREIWRNFRFITTRNHVAFNYDPILNLQRIARKLNMKRWNNIRPDFSDLGPVKGQYNIDFMNEYPRYGPYKQVVNIKSHNKYFFQTVSDFHPELHYNDLLSIYNFHDSLKSLALVLYSEYFIFVFFSAILLYIALIGSANILSFNKKTGM
jgi:NADH:ubiquinone oxidoreductase subunit 6 (subunit J)